MNEFQVGKDVNYSHVSLKIYQIMILIFLFTIGNYAQQIDVVGPLTFPKGSSKVYIFGENINVPSVQIVVSDQVVDPVVLSGRLAYFDINTSSLQTGMHSILLKNGLLTVDTGKVIIIIPPPETVEDRIKILNNQVGEMAIFIMQAMGNVSFTAHTLATLWGEAGSEQIKGLREEIDRLLEVWDGFKEEVVTSAAGLGQAVLTQVEQWLIQWHEAIKEQEKFTKEEIGGILENISLYALKIEFVPGNIFELTFDEIVSEDDRGYFILPPTWGGGKAVIGEFQGSAKLHVDSVVNNLVNFSVTELSLTSKVISPNIGVSILTTLNPNFQSAGVIDTTTNQIFATIYQIWKITGPFGESTVMDTQIIRGVLTPKGLHFVRANLLPVEIGIPTTVFLCHRPKKIYVDFIFDKEKAKEEWGEDEEKRKEEGRKFAEKTVKLLNKVFREQMKKKVKFNVGKIVERDLEECLDDTGEFKGKDKQGDGIPGTYGYNEKAIELVKKEGNNEKVNRITIIVKRVKDPNVIATAFSDNMMTKNGDKLEGKEAIIVNFDKIDNFLTGYNGSVPAHEVSHLAGLQDAPNDRMTEVSKKEQEKLKEQIKKKEIKRDGKPIEEKDIEDAQKNGSEDYEKGHLNSYNQKKRGEKDEQTLSDENQEKVEQYFKNKVARKVKRY